MAELGSVPMELPSTNQGTKVRNQVTLEGDGRPPEMGPSAANNPARPTLPWPKEPTIMSSVCISYLVTGRQGAPPLVPCDHGWCLARDKALKVHGLSLSNGG